MSLFYFLKTELLTPARLETPVNILAPFRRTVPYETSRRKILVGDLSDVGRRSREEEEEEKSEGL